MSADGISAIQEAWELLGRGRELITKLENLAADIEDPALSLSIRNARLANTGAMTRAKTLLDLERTTTGALDADLDSQHVEGARGG